MPADQGDVRRGTNLNEGYFDQHLGSLDPARTGIDEIRSVRGDLNSDGARQYLARFRFYGDDPLRKVESLSGGERTRLALGKLLLEPRNLLFLDEPTNHLDIPAAEILEEALVGFEGTVILVSHDRRFLETVTTRTLAFTTHGVDIYEGGFKDYTDALERQRKAAAEPAPKKAKAPSAPPKPEAVPGADAYRAQKAAARDLERKRKRVQELEAHISEGERENQRYRNELKEVPSTDWERLHDLAQKEQELTRKLQRWTAEWVKLSEELES